MIAKPSKQHYLTPDTILSKDKQVYIVGKLHAWDNTCKVIADSLALKDPNFKKDLFLDQCGVDYK